MSVVYFVQHPSDGLIKIGTTWNFFPRFRKLCADYNVALSILGIHDGDKTTERELHKRFHDDWRFGEWFKPSESILDYITAHTSIPQKEEKKWGGKRIRRERELSGQIINRLPELLAQKTNGKKINLSKIQKETGLSYGTVYSWVKGRPTRFDFPILNTWCKYLGVQPGDILEYRED